MAPTEREPIVVRAMAGSRAQLGACTRLCAFFLSCPSKEVVDALLGHAPSSIADAAAHLLTRLIVFGQEASAVSCELRVHHPITGATDARTHGMAACALACVRAVCHGRIAPEIVVVACMLSCLLCCAC